MKILLTAFEPFGGQTINASQEAARILRDHTFEGAHLEILYLPVERFKATQMTIEAIESLQPDIVIMLGEARGRSAITPERVAINVDNYPIPDNAGLQPREEPIQEDGPVAYFSTLPIVEITQELVKAGIPASISNTAGTYLCNHLFYGVRHYLSETNSPVLAGFIHVPNLPEQHPKDAKEWASLPQETIGEGVRIAIQSCLNQSS